MGILKGIFKGKIKTDEIVTASISGIDKLFYTKEEKADDDYKKDEFRFKVANALAEDTKSKLSENTDRSRSRRFISQAFTAVFLSLVVLYVIISLFTSLPTYAIKEMLTNETMHTAMILILTFHYSGYYLPKAVKAAKVMIDERKERKKKKEEKK